MSSFLGHSLAAATIYVAAKPPATVLNRLAWAGWLIVVASAPDIDYLIPALRLPGPPTIRLTHSLIGCQIVPWLTCFGLWLAGARGRDLRVRCIQVMLAGLSHVALDLLVGVTPAALFWPFSQHTFRLPFGILPSAGRLSWSNPVLLRNLLIEAGALGPVCAMAWLLRRCSARRHWVLMTALTALSVSCMAVAYCLKR